ncbi:MAG: hypothetical protein ACK4UJ_02755 [Leptonema sp. (in: bacteria)]
MSQTQTQNSTSTKIQLEGTESFSQKNLEADSVLLKENSKVKQLILIHSGEIGYYEPNRKTTLFVTPAKNYIVGFSYLFSSHEFPLRVIITKPSIVSVFPVNPSKGVQNIILGKLNIGLIAVNSIEKETNFFLSVYKNYLDFSKSMSNYIYNLCLSYYKLQPQLIDNIKREEEVIDKNLINIKKIKEHFIEMNQQLPKYLTKNWLIQNNLYLDYEASSFDFEDHFFEFSFLKRLSTLPIELQSQIFQKDLMILDNISKKYNKLQHEIVKEISETIYSIQEDLEFLLKGDYSLMEKFAILTDLFDTNELEINSKEMYEILEYFKEKFDQVSKHYQRTFYKKPNTSQNYEKILKKYESLKNQFKKEIEDKSSETTKTTKVVSDNKGILEELKNSTKKILNFCEIPSEEQQKTLKSLEQLRKVANPLESGPDIRKLKRPIQETFWKAYSIAMQKFRNHKGNVPKPIALFLQFGFFDEEFLEKEHLIELFDLVDTTSSKNKGFTIIDITDWINRIAEKKDLPSINELGESYFEFLRRENPNIKVKKLEEFPPNIDSIEKRIEYEIKNFVSTNSKLVSGTPMSYFSVLTKYHIVAPTIKDLFLTREKITNELNRLLEIDFSAFYREIIFNDEKAKILKEFVMINVLPYIILMPSVGNKSMLWQELEDPRRKNTPARICLPILCTGDLFSMLIEAVGAFRWEIQKTILGHDYNNVGVPSLTSEYIDYVQFYHKNRDLTEEQKEKIKLDFKNFRDDRSKFIHDYSIWIKYESQGILKLNKIVRNIMYRYIPFSKGIRENLAKQPAYADIHNRFKNLRTKKITELENRWKKYGDKAVWPPILKATYEYYAS